jgi:hypothetical protein
LNPQADEVADWFELPLSYALDPAKRVQHSVDFHGVERNYYEIMWKDRRIWGITAAILANLSRRLNHDRLLA